MMVITGRLGYAVSTDGVVWKKKGLIMDLGSSPFDRGPLMMILFPIAWNMA